MRHIKGGGSERRSKRGPIFGTTKISALLTNAQTGFAIVNDGLLGPPCLAVETVENECIVSMTRRHCFALQANP